MSTELDELRAKLTCLGISLREIGGLWYINHIGNFYVEGFITSRRELRGSELAFTKYILANLRSRLDENT
jgi:hypothetical protein